MPVQKFDLDLADIKTNLTPRRYTENMEDLDNKEFEEERKEEEEESKSVTGGVENKRFETQSGMTGFSISESIFEKNSEEEVTEADLECMLSIEAPLIGDYY